MITKQDAMTKRYFHCGECTKVVGPRGGVKMYREEWRANGACKTWKTRPDEFRLPIKHGLYDFSYITQSNAGLFHTADDCPLDN